MDSPKYDLKLFLHDASRVELETFIPLFHRWIQTQCLEELLIDVADYRHVPYGPGIVLIAHDAHYAMDMADGRLGLLYSRRRETHPSRKAIYGVEDRLWSVLHCALTAGQHLETNPAFQGQLRFRGDELLVRLNDRLLASNTEAAYDELCQALEPFLATLYPDSQVAVEHVREGASRLTVVIKAAENPDVATLLSRLGPRRSHVTTTETRG
jgi:hypothetical protein